MGVLVSHILHICVRMQWLPPRPHPFREGVTPCTTQALQQTLGQPARPCVVGPSWTGRLPPRWRPGRRPAAPSAQASAVFLGIESPAWPAGPSISRGVTPPGSAPARSPCQGFLGTHTQSRRTCAHTHAHSLSHTPINQSPVSLISLTSARLPGWGRSHRLRAGRLPEGWEGSVRWAPSSMSHRPPHSLMSARGAAGAALVTSGRRGGACLSLQRSPAARTDRSSRPSCRLLRKSQRAVSHRLETHLLPRLALPSSLVLGGCFPAVPTTAIPQSAAYHSLQQHGSHRAGPRRCWTHASAWTRPLCVRPLPMPPGESDPRPN